MLSKENKAIKKLYGEKFLHFCKNSFSTILNDEGQLLKILTKNFAPTHSLISVLEKDNNADKFIDYIYSLYKIKTRPVVKTDKTAVQLFDEAGYILYPECKSDSDINEFKSYYFDYEALCTFGGKRLKTCRVWFAVKKNVNQINRLDFTNPQREDEYGTSVLSIQFTRGNVSRLSIKNRYNHTVKNPDATFNNNLDNIIPGLMHSFVRDYKINASEKVSLEDFGLPGFVKDRNDVFHKLNIRNGNTFFCENNIVVVNGEPIQFDKSSTMLIDNYLIDFKKKKVISLIKPEKDEFVKLFKKIVDIKIVKKEDGNREITVTNSDNQKIVFEINSKNQIISYYNPYATTIKNNFLHANIALKKIDLPNVESIGNGFLKTNKKLNQISIKKVKTIGEDFLRINDVLEVLEIPNVTQIKSRFLMVNNKIKKLDMPLLKYVGDDFLTSNIIFNEINAPQLEQVGNYFLQASNELAFVDFPKLKIIEKKFLSNVKMMKSISLPQAIKVGDFFMNNSLVESVDLQKAETIGDFFLSNNYVVQHLNLASAKTIGDEFCYGNQSLKKLELTNTTKVGRLFLSKNEDVQVVANNLKRVGHSYLKAKQIKLQNQNESQLTT